jgi:hypothetical protein
MKTKCIPVLLLCTAGAAAGAGIGWILRGTPSRDVGHRNGASALTAAAGDKSKTAGSNKGLSGAPSEADDLLGSELARCTGAMRWLFLLGAAEKAAPADMPGLLRAAKGDSAATRMLAVHWAEIGPKHMLETLFAERTKRLTAGKFGADRAEIRDLLDVLFEEWPKRDPEGAIAALNGAAYLLGGEGLRQSVVNTVMKTDTERALKLMKEWSVNNYIPNMAALTKWAEQNPLAAAKSVMENTSSYACTEALDQIGKVWAATDPAGALAYADELRGLPGSRLASATVREWAKRDLNGVISCVTSQTDSLTKTRLALPLMEAWARSDPQAALQWTQENLKGEARAASAASIVRTMAEKDIQSASAFIGGLEPGGVKNRAVSELINTWLSKERKDDVAPALAWIASLPEADARSQAWQYSAWRLFYSNPDETIAFLGTEAGQKTPQQIFDNGARYLAKKNPESAMQWAAALPADRASGARQTVLETWLSSRPGAATEWVRTLPAGTERDESIRLTVSTLSNQSLDQTKEWLGTLPAADRNTARAAIGSLPISPEKREALSAGLK